MSWIHDLYSLYNLLEPEISSDLLDNSKYYSEKGLDVLVPISWTTAKITTEVTIDSDGNFLDIRSIPEEEQMTLIPSTIQASSRSSAITLFPLFDYLFYIATDFFNHFPNFTKSEKKTSPKDIQKFQQELKKQQKLYYDQLEDWCNSQYGNLKVKAILKYLKKGTLTKDYLDNIQNIPLDSTINIRIKVINKNDDNDISEIWRDYEVIKSWQNYYKNIVLPKEVNNSKNKDVLIGLDYITGEECIISYSVSGKIRNSADAAKLFSKTNAENDKVRLPGDKLLNPSQICSYGYESAEKITHTLRYLATHQGVRNNTESIICWTPSFAGEELKEIIMPDDYFEELFDFEEKSEIDTGAEFANRFNQKLKGYKAKINDTENVYIIGLDTADGNNKGRLAITSFMMLSVSKILENVENWHNTCHWELPVFDKDKNCHFIDCSPLPRDIVTYAYGIERDKKIVLDNDKLKAKQIKTIYSCISQGKRIPRSFVQKLVMNVSQRNRYDKHWNKLVRIACALIQKEKYDYQNYKEGIQMEENRDYLFGELMALFEKCEETILYKNDKKRQTTMEKFWNVMVSRPAKTTALIQCKVNKYLSVFYKNQIQDIVCKIDELDGYTDNRLGADYVLGYYHKMNELKNYKNNRGQENE